jgi:hypothetical protein
MPRESHSELYEEVCEMYLVATVTLVTALMALLILGFLRVARDLLSRGIYETPSCQENDNFEQVERASGHWMPGMVEYSGEPNSCSPNNPLSHSFMESLTSLHQKIEGQNSRPRSLAASDANMEIDARGRSNGSPSEFDMGIRGPGAACTQVSPRSAGR